MNTGASRRRCGRGTWLYPTLDYEHHLGIGAKLVQVNGIRSAMGMTEELEQNPGMLSITWLAAEVNNLTALLARTQEPGTRPVARRRIRRGRRPWRDAGRSC